MNMASITAYIYIQLSMKNINLNSINRQKLNSLLNPCTDCNQVYDPNFHVPPRKIPDSS